MSVWFLGNTQWATPAAALAVTACVSATSPAQEVYALQRTFDELLVVAVEYGNQPPCTPERIIACHDPEVLNRIIEVAGDVDVALDTAELAVRSNAATPPDHYIALARAALFELQKALVQGSVTTRESLGDPV